MAHKIKLESVQYEIVRLALTHYANSLDAELLGPNMFKDATKESSVARRMVNKEFAEREDTNMEDDNG